MVAFDTSVLYLIMIIFCPFLGFILNLIFFKKTPQMGSRVASLLIRIGLINSLIAWFVGLPFSEKSESWGFMANEISWVMATLILFVSAIVHNFSLSYMSGDRNYRRYFLLLGLSTISTLLMVASDNLVFLILFWSLSNIALILLMVHKSHWLAAKNSGILATKVFVLGLIFLSAGLGLLAAELETVSLSQIVVKSVDLSIPTRLISISFIFLGAFTQSGCWPFHRWLISSLNSPTPVSALMHAGLVNGGGVLLARFSTIFLQESLILNILFVLAMITLTLGGIWKLLQCDIKRMLACSTMTQMGFMMMQCSLGFFPAALAHLCWHGLFKAFLFLRSGSTVAEHRCTNEERLSSIPIFFLSSICGLLGSLGFIFGSHLSFNFYDTTLVLVFFSWMASTQLAHTILEKKLSLIFLLSASIVCFATGFIYGLTVYMIEIVLEPLHIWQPQELNWIHIVAIIFIFFIWLALNLKTFTGHETSVWWRRFYVKMLNASQPNFKTITSNKNGYNF